MEASTSFEPGAKAPALAPTRPPRLSASRRRILIVNCYFDESRESVARPHKIPQAVGPIYLAGAFAPELCDVVCYSELASGVLEDPRLLGWPELLVLTGLTSDFDRMLHLTAYARTLNPTVIVVAGGPAVRALPLLARRFFNYVCDGDIEELQDVARDALGSAYVAEEMLPRYDLAYWLGKLGYVESTRYCNFRCSFCSLTGEERAYQTYDLDYIRRQIVAGGKRKRILFIDNNFYGNDREHFRARIGLINELRSLGYFHTWSALVTNDFFRDDENLKLVKDAGCELLFSGVESFDARWLRRQNKLQNTSAPQVELIRKCLEAGIMFAYGLMVDPATRPIEELRCELEFVTATPQITLPSFVTVAIPILGTPYFFDCLKQRTLLPDTKLRDMDGATLTQRTIDPVGEVTKFLADLQSFRGLRSRVIGHCCQFTRLYGHKFSAAQLGAALTNGLLLCAHDLATTFSELRWRRAVRTRTYISSTEQPDRSYTPAFPVESRFERYFKPTMVTDARGELHDDLIGSGLLERGSPRRAIALATAG